MNSQRVRFWNLKKISTAETNSFLEIEFAYRIIILYKYLFLAPICFFTITDVTDLINVCCLFQAFWWPWTFFPYHYCCNEREGSKKWMNIKRAVEMRAKTIKDFRGRQGGTNKTVCNKHEHSAWANRARARVL